MNRLREIHRLALALTRELMAIASLCLMSCSYSSLSLWGISVLSENGGSE